MKHVARIDCDSCSKACIEGIGGDMATLDQVVGEAEDEGWLIDIDAGDVWPDCQTNADDSPPSPETMEELQ